MSASMFPAAAQPARASAGDATLSRELAGIVGPANVLSRSAELLAYSADGLPTYRMLPRLVVFPTSRDELVAVVRALARAGVPFVPRGAGTGLSGGALGDPDTVVVALNRLTRILTIDPENRLAVVQPGAVNVHLSRAAARHGLHYAPDPSSQTACTIGGNVAENSGGPHCLKYGVTLNHIVALTVVLPDGELVQLGSADGECDGYDLLGAFIGSEGCFGIAVEITVRLVPLPPAVRTLLADFTSITDGAHAVSAIIARGLLPAAMEMMDGPTVRAVEASVYAAGYPADAEAVLLIELDGLEDGMDADVRVVESLCRDAGARSVRVAREEAERARLWQGRKKAFGAMGRVAPDLMVQDAVIPRTRLPDVLATIAGIADRHGIQVCNVFHAGDGNLHPNIGFDGRDPAQRERVERAMTEIMRACLDAGGSVTGEHGIGLDKLRYMPLAFDAASLDAMCRLRAVFDPAQRANPAKVVPVHSCREWRMAPAARSRAAGDDGLSPLTAPTA
ncbi:MAG TPA: FAD-linked oxidase C-terminal domain-containing protein [Gemmatimonadaceae bacterium]|nr:FAD-linked oxidase C-terminal domain-containing protein [Gemmatimonadaceae bacterium]